MKELLLVLTIAAVSASSTMASDTAQPRDHHRSKQKAVPHPATLNDCTAYGEGFVKVAGTNTCVRIGGGVAVDSGFNVGR